MGLQHQQLRLSIDTRYLQGGQELVGKVVLENRRVMLGLGIMVQLVMEDMSIAEASVYTKEEERDSNGNTQKKEVFDRIEYFKKVV